MNKGFGMLSQLLQIGIGKEKSLEKNIEKVRINVALIFSVVIFICLGFWVNQSSASENVPLYTYFFWGCGLLSFLLYLWNYFQMHYLTRFLGYLLYLIAMLVFSVNSFFYSSEDQALSEFNEWLFYFLLMTTSFYVFISFSTRWAPIGVLFIMLFGIIVSIFGKSMIYGVVGGGVGLVTWGLLFLWNIITDAIKRSQQTVVEEETILNEMLQQIQIEETEEEKKAKLLEETEEHSQVSVSEKESPAPHLTITGTSAEQITPEDYEEIKAKLQQYEEHLFQMEKLITLGKLVAGITHEINTPIGAVNAANTNLKNLLPTLTTEMPQIVEMLDKEQREAFFKLLDQALQERPSLSSREERKRKKVLQEELEKQGFENARSLAGELVKMGIYENITPYLPLFKHENSEKIFEFLSNFAKLRTNISNIDIASEKIMKMVKAVRSYIYQKQERKLTPTNIIQNIETVLTLYHNMLKYGINVIKEYDEEIPDINCYPDELSQVWTNLIHNAAQAMEGQGELRIQVGQDDQYVYVSIQDNGPGIPDEIKDRIFEPFFTTKPEGEGTGLGLDIVKKIVEDHHKGKIELFSEPGKTIFKVYIPKNLT